MVYCTAHVAKLDIQTASQGNVDGSCHIEFRTERFGDEDLSREGNCWRGMFRNPVIVRGYPILRRPMADTGVDMVDAGLEIPLEMVAALTNCRRVVRFADTTFVKGFAAMLAAVRIVGNVVFWHLCYNPRGEYVSYEDHRVRRGLQELSMHVLEKSRHIVGWSDNIRNCAGSSVFAPLLRLLLTTS